jgi:hypothetical protein
MKKTFFSFLFCHYFCAVFVENWILRRMISYMLGKYGKFKKNFGKNEFLSQFSIERKF